MREMPRVRSQAAAGQPDTRSSEGKSYRSKKGKSPEAKGRERNRLILFKRASQKEAYARPSIQNHY